VTWRLAPQAEGGVPGGLGPYDRGATPWFACAADPRFAYCLFVPAAAPPGGHPLVVTVHGTGRRAEAARDALAPLADSHGAIILAPLFPAGIEAPGALSGYKRLRTAAAAYDLVLLAMIDEVAARHPLAGGGFWLHGFSGGAHLAHRFLYAHPERLAGVSIAAPGIVTLPDADADWPGGVRGLEQRVGRPFDAGAVARVPLQVCVGARDTETWEIALTPGDGWWSRGGAWQAGLDRIGRAQGLARALRALGGRVDFDLVPDAGHSGAALVDPVRRWLAGQLDKARGRGD
jgi:hypothetical protein